MTSQNSTGALRRVYVRPPVADTAANCELYGWHSPFDPGKAAEEHDAFRAQLDRAGADVIVGSTPVPGDPDAIYTYDPVLVTDRGVIALRPGKAARRDEPAAVAADLAAAGVPTLGTLTAPAQAEGGDMFWLDEATLLIGRGYRTNDEGIAQLQALVPDVTTHVFDLPHQAGPDSCLHLLSLISPLDQDLVLCFLPLLPVRLVELLRERAIDMIQVPTEEFDSMGTNVLALGPRIALALARNPETRRRVEAAGVEVRIYRGDEISLKGDGGPTCLTRPLERG